MADFGRDIQQLLLSPSETWDSAEVKGWYATEFEQIFTWRKSAFLAAIFTLLAAVIATQLGVASWFPTRSTRLVAALPYVLIGTAFGACVWPGYRMSVFVYRLAGKIRRVNPFVPTTAGIFNIGRTLVRFEGVGIALILLFGAAFSQTPFPLSNKIILYSASIVSLAWTLWFFFTQSQIHRVMLRYKHEKQDWFADHYEKTLSKAVRKPDREAFEELETLILLKKEIDSIPVWPFDTRALLTSLALVSTPIIAALAKRLLGT